MGDHRAWFDEYIYHDSLQARAIEGIGHSDGAGGLGGLCWAPLESISQILAGQFGGLKFKMGLFAQ